MLHQDCPQAHNQPIDCQSSVLGSSLVQDIRCGTLLGSSLCSRRSRIDSHELLQPWANSRSAHFALRGGGVANSCASSTLSPRSIAVDLGRRQHSAFMAWHDNAFVSCDESFISSLVIQVTANILFHIGILLTCSLEPKLSQSWIGITQICVVVQVRTKVTHGFGFTRLLQSYDSPCRVSGLHPMMGG